MAMGSLAVGYFGLVGEIDFSEEKLTSIILWIVQVALIFGITFVVFKKTRKPLEEWIPQSVSQSSRVIADSCPHCSSKVGKNQKRCVKCGAKREYGLLSKHGNWIIAPFFYLCFPAGALFAFGALRLMDDNLETEYWWLMFALAMPFIITFILFQIFKTPTGEWKK